MQLVIVPAVRANNAGGRTIMMQILVQLSKNDRKMCCVSERCSNVASSYISLVASYCTNVLGYTVRVDDIVAIVFISHKFSLIIYVLGDVWPGCGKLQLLTLRHYLILIFVDIIPKILILNKPACTVHRFLLRDIFNDSCPQSIRFAAPQAWHCIR